jgi:hypothetical protein
MNAVSQQFPNTTVLPCIGNTDTIDEF